jgi:hypothetical protein
MARGFDPVSLESGGAAAFVDDILVIGQVVHFRISASGTLVYLRGNRTTTGQGFLLSIAEEGGNIERLNLDYDDFRFPSVSPDGNQIAVHLTLATVDLRRRPASRLDAGRPMDYVLFQPRREVAHLSTAGRRARRT